MEKRERAQRLAFLDLSDEDLARLRALRPILESHADRLVAVFYRHLLAFEETRALLGDSEIKRRLLDKQRAYLLSLSDGSIDDRYVENRTQIGKTHMRIGLEPRWYLGAYALYVRLLAPIVMESYEDPREAEKTVTALYKVLSFDSQLAMEAYIQGRQQQLEFLNRELGDASRELRRVYDRQADELRQTSARARAAEELASVATLVAGLAHEIGTPMSVIQGHAELLESSVHDERGRWRLETIREQIERISHIMQTLVNIARPQTREHAPVDIEAVLQQSVAFLSEKFRSRGIHAKVQTTPLPPLTGDAEKLQQLFLNLLLNSADAMPEGGTIEVDAHSDGEGGGIEICVHDTGHGMPQSVQDRIFEPFYTTKEAGRGSGLGLMVAAGIVRDHGGEISVESAEGRGTSFCIRFPGPENES